MTTEDDFQKLLDACPDDHHTRGVFGDWLCDRGDPRGEGYIALARCGLRPYIAGTDNEDCWWHDATDTSGKSSNSMPHDWYAALMADGTPDADHLWPRQDFKMVRRAAEDAAALAFARLPEARRRELLTPEGVPV